MFFSDYTVFVYVALFIGIYNFSRFCISNFWLKNILTLAGNLLILLLFVKEHSLIVIAILSALVFGVGHLLKRKKLPVLQVGMLVFVLLLFALRNYPYLRELLSKSILDFIEKPLLSVQKLGISYILFRLVHWLVETRRGTIQRYNLLTFLNYIFFFPSFLAGPIDSYKNFHFWLASNRNAYSKSLFFAGVTRIFLGAVKTVLIVPLIIIPATDYTTLVAEYGAWGGVSLSLVLYSAYIYLDFSGYSDIAIGTAYTLGIRTPENFSNPYISKNLAEFWRRWHITFSLFLRAYVFIPIVKGINKISPFQARLPVTIAAYIITFTLCGMWHGDQIHFIYWGLLHGVGLGINKVWTTNFGRKTWAKTKFYRGVSLILTFIFVTFCWMFFTYEMQEIEIIFDLLF